ncbi:MAG: hypothetical protein NC299_04050 [Lachnospiraceae bacterium]|nr:hypothetical protein [Ruminococcus sp.]MCM1274520.1 hypothetical protein [Lachnospiraceae bacterium]
MSNEKNEMAISMTSEELIERCRKIIEDAKSEIKLPNIDFKDYEVTTWDLFPSLTFTDSTSKLEIKRKAKEMCREAYDNRNNAVNEKAEYLAKRLYNALGDNAFLKWARDTANGALDKCRVLLDAANIPCSLEQIDVPFPTISVDYYDLVRELKDDVVESDDLYSFDNYFSNYCTIEEFSYGTGNPLIFRLQFGMNMTDYRCDIMDYLDEIAKDLNSSLSINFKRIWVKYFSDEVKANMLDGLLLLVEINNRRAGGTENVPNTLAEYCAAVYDVLDARLEKISESVGRAVCSVV